MIAIQKHKVTNMVAFRSPPAKIHIIFHPTKYFDDKTQKTHFTPKIHKNTDLFLMEMNVSIVSELSSITVKFVLKLFRTYITSDYFLYLCNGLTALPPPKPMTNLQGVGRIWFIVKRLKYRRYGFVFVIKIIRFEEIIDVR